MEITDSWPQDASSDEDRPVMHQREPRLQGGAAVVGEVEDTGGWTLFGAGDGL